MIQGSWVLVNYFEHGGDQIKTTDFLINTIPFQDLGILIWLRPSPELEDRGRKFSGIVVVRIPFVILKLGTTTLGHWGRLERVEVDHFIWNNRGIIFTVLISVPFLQQGHNQQRKWRNRYQYGHNDNTHEETYNGILKVIILSREKGNLLTVWYRHRTWLKDGSLILWQRHGKYLSVFQQQKYNSCHWLHLNSSRMLVLLDEWWRTGIYRHYKIEGTFSSFNGILAAYHGKVTEVVSDP